MLILAISHKSLYKAIKFIGKLWNCSVLYFQTIAACPKDSDEELECAVHRAADFNQSVHLLTYKRKTVSVRAVGLQEIQDQASPLDRHKENAARRQDRINLLQK